MINLKSLTVTITQNICLCPIIEIACHLYVHSTGAADICQKRPTSCGNYRKKWQTCLPMSKPTSHPSLWPCRMAAAAVVPEGGPGPNLNWHARSKPSLKTFHTMVIVTSASTTISRLVSACCRKSTSDSIPASKLSRNSLNNQFPFRNKTT